MYPLPRASRPLGGRLSPEKGKKRPFCRPLSTASNVLICYGYYVLHSYCVLHLFNPKGGNESTKTKLVEKFTKALPKLFGGLKVTITCRSVSLLVMFTMF